MPPPQTSPARPPQVMSLPWLAMWALLLCLAWLMPNHFPPWSAFHADAWMAMAVAVGAITLCVRLQSAVQWHSLALVVAAIVPLPWLQYLGGVLPFMGQAWMSSFYLLGFLLCLLTGAAWETSSPGQLPRALFMAIGFAALVSVWLQLYTWSGQWEGDVMDLWSMGYRGARPYANLGQPNQLATLLIWALLACLWAYVTGIVGAGTALLAAAFLLLGIALTQSRMAWLALSSVLVAVWYWRRLWPSRKIPWAASGLYLFFWVCPFLLRWLHGLFAPAQVTNFLRMQEQGELRLSAWRLFAAAALEQPWLGYGWTELAAAQMAVADKMPGLPATFGHSHNLFLDLVLWCGLPLGLLLGVVVVRWFWLHLRAVRQPQDAALFLVLCVVGIHALVELPLHYAYFLLPVGLLMGVMHVRLGTPVIRRTPRWTLVALCLTGTMALAVTVRDYFHVEASYNTYRFEFARIGLGKNPIGSPPDVLVLTHLREWIRLARYSIDRGMSDADLDWMTAVIRTYPTPGGAFQLARALALNGHPDRAAPWLERACRITDAATCQQVRLNWQQESQNDATLAAVPWPAR